MTCYKTINQFHLVPHPTDIGHCSRQTRPRQSRGHRTRPRVHGGHVAREGPGHPHSGRQEEDAKSFSARLVRKVPLERV